MERTELKEQNGGRSGLGVGKLAGKIRQRALDSLKNSLDHAVFECTNQR